MHIEFFLEEESAEAALLELIPRVCGDQVSFRPHVFQGKPDLLAKLPARLRGMAKWLPADWRIIVLLDADSEDCRVLKDRMERIAKDAGLTTKTSPSPDGRFKVVNRLAVEELEAWFFGDTDALRTAFPRVSPSLARQAPYRDPDRIRGGTWEALERVLQRAGYYRGGLAKVDSARRIATHMNPTRNRSRSFQVFIEGVRQALD
jgi:hypothetical protein